MKLNMSQLAKEMRSRIFTQMLESRGWKYRAFLRYLKIFKYVSLKPRRGEFLEYYYTLMRYLDDIVDGDAPLPPNYDNEAGYILEKIAFLSNPTAPKDDAENMILFCFALAEKFGEDFREETTDILNSLYFDAQRRNKRTIYTREELIFHFHLLDIRGTIKATLKIFNDDPEKYGLLEPLGMACRHQYNLEDIISDLEAGYVNIPLEECRQFGITDADLALKSSPAISAWMNHHALEGLALLEKHHRLLTDGKFSIFEKLVFRLVYENPARKTFKKVLACIQPPNN